MNEFKGMNGNLLAFKEEVADAEKVTFAGALGVCTLLQSFSPNVIRDKEYVFVMD